MQGGIRRKNDLLPRYRKGSSQSKQSYLTTPMKKVIAYVIVLVTMWMIVQTVLSDSKREVSYELESAVQQSGIHTDGSDSFSDSTEVGNKVPKERFNNEVAMQQEVKNLEKDYRKDNSKDVKQEVGNDVKAMKQDSEPKEVVDEQAKMINEKAPYKKTGKS